MMRVRVASGFNAGLLKTTHQCEWQVRRHELDLDEEEEEEEEKLAK